MDPVQTEIVSSLCAYMRANHRTYILQLCCLDLRVQVSPFQNLIPSHSWCEGHHGLVHEIETQSLTNVGTFKLNILARLASKDRYLCPVFLWKIYDC